MRVSQPVTCLCVYYCLLVQAGCDEQSWNAPLPPWPTCPHIMPTCAVCCSLAAHSCKDAAASDVRNVTYCRIRQSIRRTPSLFNTSALCVPATLMCAQKARPTPYRLYSSCTQHGGISSQQHYTVSNWSSTLPLQWCNRPQTSSQDRGGTSPDKRRMNNETHWQGT